MNIDEQVKQNMQEMVEAFAKAGVELTLPPLSSITMGTRYKEIDIRKSLTIQIPFNEKYTNPLKMFQGGFISAAFDEAFGPLTYMAAQRPVVTLEMSTSFVRPFTAKDAYIEIKAEVVSQTKTILLLKAEAKSKSGKLIATASNHSLIVSDNNLKKSNT